MQEKQVESAQLLQVLSRVLQVPQFTPQAPPEPVTNHPGVCPLYMSFLPGAPFPTWPARVRPSNGTRSAFFHTDASKLGAQERHLLYHPEP